MFKAAIEDALMKTKRNIPRFRGLFPHVSVNNTYLLNENKEWTCGFWPGLLWLSYEYSKDITFLYAAEQTVAQLGLRLKNKDSIEHHDIGFLYSLSAKAEWIIQKEASAKELSLRAADHLMGRWRASGQYIQAWGAIGDANSGGRIIIDCMMNLPLLYWASEQTGDPAYRQAAEIHAEKSRRFLVRGDDSSYHTFHFDQDTGVPIGGTTHQGYTNGSTWSRGQAWGIYGFALSYRYTLNPDFLKTSKRLAAYFLNHLPEDHVAFWDFDAPQAENLFRDSSASAIAAAGILELLDLMNPQDPDIPFFKQGLERSMVSLVNNYSTMNEPDAEGLLNHGSYHVRGNVSPDDFMIWGDYFYLESLIRIETGMAGYWYERK